MKLLLKILLLLIALSSNLHAQKVLRFTGQPDNAHSFHGLFWPRNMDLGRFYWDAWVKPTSSGYLVSDGYGGAHALLWGWNGGLPGPVNGNVWSPAGMTSFNGSYIIAQGEWVHAAVAWDGANLYTYINGIPDGRTPFAGPRRAGAGADAGWLYVGGSDHLNAGCDLAILRCWDRLDNLSLVPYLACVPERTTARWDMAGVPCDFLCDYTQGNLFDSSPRGVSSTADPTQREFHHGRLFTTKGEIAGVHNHWVQSRGPLPKWVDDPTCPFGQDFTSPLPAENIPAPLTCPAGALVFDSFGRRNQTYAYQKNPTLGSTEAGSLGPLPWQVAGGGLPKLWGLLQGSAVYIGHASPAVAWVDCDITNQDVRITRVAGAPLTGETGLAFRVVDGANYWKLSYDTTNHGRLGRWNSGVYTEISTAAANPAFTILRVTVDANNAIRCYHDDGAGGWTQMGSTVTDDSLANGEGAGIATTDVSSGQNALARYKRFTVFGM